MIQLSSSKNTNTYDSNKEIGIAQESVFKEIQDAAFNLDINDLFEKPWFEDYLPMIREYYNIYGDDMVGFSAKKDGKLDIYLRCPELYEVEVKKVDIEYDGSKDTSN